MDLGREQEKGMPHDMEKEMMNLPPGLDKSGIANYVPSQRLEWKRYKQYTRNDIMAAIEEVKSGRFITLILKSDPTFIEIVAPFSSFTSDLELKMAERLPNKRKSIPKNWHEP